MLIKITLAALLVIAILAVVIATRPADYTVTRSALIGAAPEAVYAQVADFHRWQAWSPWEKLDPAMKKTYGGAPSGTGATYAWRGNKEVGEGRMTILDAQPARRVAIKLEFLKPFASTSDAIFTFQPAAGGTQTTWSMAGQKNFAAKAFSLFMDMDRMIGSDFEKGLANLSAASQSSAAR